MGVPFWKSMFRVKSCLWSDIVPNKKHIQAAISNLLISKDQDGGLAEFVVTHQFVEFLSGHGQSISVCWIHDQNHELENELKFVVDDFCDVSTDCFMLPCNLKPHNLIILVSILAWWHPKLGIRTGSLR